MTVLTRSEDVARLCDRLAQEPYIAVDTEFMRERTYWPRLCLVQVAGSEDAVAIDPMAEGIDLEPLHALLADQSVLKVFHAARQDLEIFYHLTGRVPHPIFDTQVAAMVCGHGDQVSYSQLAERLAGAKIEKTSRFTDWAARPLAQQQIAYAIDDVTHLRTIYEKLKARLEKNGRAHWLTEEMEVLEDPATYALEPREAWHRIKIPSSKPRHLAVLRELAAWRESEAQRRDIPKARIVKDEALAQIAMQMPRDEKALSKIRLLPRGFANGQDGRGVLEAVKAGLAVDDEDMPRRDRNERLEPAPQSLIDLMKVLLKAKCEEAGVASRLVATSPDVERFAASDAPDQPLMHGWRWEIFGADAHKLKQGRLALAPGGGRLRVIELEEG